MEQVLQFLITKPNSQQAQVTADPWTAIPVKSLKYANDTSEIHLGGINAETLSNFKDFLNLQTVWLNNNKLTSLEGLEANFRIKHLYCQNNHISSIEKTLPLLKHLETLFLYNNQLRDLDKVLSLLRSLKSLKSLQLHQNPLSQQPNYKARVVWALPHLEILDRHKITLQQHQSASRLMKSLK